MNRTHMAILALSVSLAACDSTVTVDLVLDYNPARCRECPREAIDLSAGGTVGIFVTDVAHPELGPFEHRCGPFPPSPGSTLVDLPAYLDNSGIRLPEDMEIVIDVRVWSPVTFPSDECLTVDPPPDPVVEGGSPTPTRLAGDAITIVIELSCTPIAPDCRP